MDELTVRELSPHRFRQTAGDCRCQEPRSTDLPDSGAILIPLGDCPPHRRAGSLGRGDPAVQSGARSARATHSWPSRASTGAQPEGRILAGLTRLILRSRNTNRTVLVELDAGRACSRSMAVMLEITETLANDPEDDARSGSEGGCDRDQGRRLLGLSYTFAWEATPRRRSRVRRPAAPGCSSIPAATVPRRDHPRLRHQLVSKGFVFTNRTPETCGCGTSFPCESLHLRCLAGQPRVWLAANAPNLQLKLQMSNQPNNRTARDARVQVRVLHESRPTRSEGPQRGRRPAHFGKKQSPSVAEWR